MSLIVFESSNHTKFTYSANLYPPSRHFTAKIQLSIDGEPRTIIYTKKKDLMLIIPRKDGEEIFGAFGLVQPDVDFPVDVKGFFECSINGKGKLLVHAYQRPNAKW